MKNKALLLKMVLLFIIVLPVTTYAHVKWFSQALDTSAISDLSDLNTPSFWFLFGLSVVTIAAIVYLDKILLKWQSFKKFNDYLASYGDRAVVILRVFTGAALLLSWQADSIIAPELKISSFVGWLQFFLAVSLLTSKTTPIAGIGMIGLYLYSMVHFGFFHMLDYLVYPMIGYFLFISSFKDQKIVQTRVPALYIGLGFSLCWAALEKIFFPNWGLDVLRQQPMLTMGLPAEFFLMACAFVELSLGYLLIIGVLQRSLALTITLVFFTTSAFFGKTEVIGHTILHGALLVFAVIGPGHYYPTPIEFHQRLGLRALFAAVNFVIVVTVLGLAYFWMANR